MMLMQEINAISERWFEKSFNMRKRKILLISAVSVVLLSCACPFADIPLQIIDRFSPQEPTEVVLPIASETPLGDLTGTPTMEPTATEAVKSDDLETAIHRGNLARTGVYHSPGPKSLPSLVWKFDTEGVIGRSSPVIYQGIAYIGSETGFYAIDIQTGQSLWHYETTGSVHTSPSMADGKLYFGSEAGVFYALDSITGEPLWTYTIGYEINASPILFDGLVYFGCDDGFFYALDAHTGHEAWRFEVDGNVDSLMGFFKAVRASSAISNGRILFGNTQIGTGAELHFYALDLKTGQKQWAYETGFLTSSPAVYEGIVYMGGYKNLIGLHIDSGALVFQQAIDEGTSAPAILDGIAYFGCDGGKVVALDLQNSQEVWVFETGRSVYIDSAPSIADGVLYVGSGDGFMYALDLQTGEMLWEYETGKGISSSPVISAGILYFGTDEGLLFALE